MKKELKEAILGIEVTQFDGQKADLEELVNPKQLENVISDWMPETLSQEWIRANQERKGTHFYVNVIKLQNLLVPKQELPVIPKFVEDWIEERKSIADHWFEALEDLAVDEHSGFLSDEGLKVYEWVVNNPDIYVDAYRLGYEVEQKYIVMIPHRLNNAFDLYLCETEAAVYFLDKEDEFNGRVKYKFTEEEINEINPDYMTFAKPIEELEE